MTATSRNALKNLRRVLAAAGFTASLLATSLASAQTLVTWDSYLDAESNAVMEQLNKNFEAAHPGVTIDRTGRHFDDLSLTLKLALASGDGPDVTKVNQGAADQGALAQQGLLLPIDKYVAQYGWDNHQADGVLARARWSADGQFGEGDTYGISGQGEIVGLYYNQKVLADAGIAQPPATFEELLADVEILKSKGVTPFVIGTAKQYMVLHMLAAIEQAHTDATNRQALDDVIYGRGGSPKTDAALTAATTVQDWATKGAFLDGYQGIAGADAVQLFVAGGGAFMISGTWQFGVVQNNADVHFMAVPPAAGVTKPLTVGSVDLSWSITSNAEDPAIQDLAAQYIDYMLSAEAATIWGKAGYFPSVAMSDPAVVTSTTLAEGLAMWTVLGDNNALGHYPDWASPTMMKTYDDGTPLMLAGSMTPEAFVDTLDADYQAYIAAK